MLFSPLLLLVMNVFVVLYRKLLHIKWKLYSDGMR